MSEGLFSEKLKDELRDFLGGSQARSPVVLVLALPFETGAAQRDEFQELVSGYTLLRMVGAVKSESELNRWSTWRLEIILTANGQMMP